jgi:hypothetical protein
MSRLVLSLYIIFDLKDARHLMCKPFRPIPLRLCFHHPAQCHHTADRVDIDTREARKWVSHQFRLHRIGNRYVAVRVTSRFSRDGLATAKSQEEDER